MFKINDNYLKLPGSYLFSTIAKKVQAFQAANPDKEIIRLGIGDVTLPLAPVVIDTLHGAVDEMSKAETFHGYAPDLGYDFLRNAILALSRFTMPLLTEIWCMLLKLKVFWNIRATKKRSMKLHWKIT